MQRLTGLRLKTAGRPKKDKEAKPEGNEGNKGKASGVLVSQVSQVVEVPAPLSPCGRLLSATGGERLELQRLQSCSVWLPGVVRVVMAFGVFVETAKGWGMVPLEELPPEKLRTAAAPAPAQAEHFGLLETRLRVHPTAFPLGEAVKVRAPLYGVGRFCEVRCVAHQGTSPASPRGLRLPTAYHEAERENCDCDSASHVQLIICSSCARVIRQLRNPSRIKPWAGRGPWHIAQSVAGPLGPLEAAQISEAVKVSVLILR